jgi:hypothetical protein
LIRHGSKVRFEGGNFLQQAYALLLQLQIRSFQLGFILAQNTTKRNAIQNAKVV